MPHKTTV